MTGRIDQNGVVEWSEEDQCFIGSCPGIIGPCCHGDDEDEVYRELHQIISEWLEIEEQDATATHSAQQPFIETYTQQIKFHLSQYRRCNLGVEEYGTFRDKAYEHILPRSLLWLNLIETFRREIRESLEESGIGLDQYFHHLNSSQAACLNLFWPLLNHPERDLILESLGIGPDNVVNWAFEKAIGQIGQTRCDLYLELESGARAYIEVNYTGHGFGRSISDERHRERLKNIFASALCKFVVSEYLESEKLFSYYQLLRILSDFVPERNDSVVFLFPRGHERVADKARNVLDAAIETSAVRSKILIRFLDDVVSDALACLAGEDHLLHTHLQLYREKYFI